MSAVSSDAGFSRAVISIRIVDIDYYLMPLDKYSPHLAFQAARLTLPGAHTSPKLPTVRIFGCTPAGQKACLHLHGARPFLYVPLPEGVEQADAASFSNKLRGILESNLALSYAQDSVSGLTGQSAAGSVPAVPFIDNIEPVLRTSIYGYYPEPSIFLKISVYNPRNIQRIATILYSGIHVPGGSLPLQLQPFESHIPFILQIMTDLSLVGMGYINLSACKFRLPMPQSPRGMAAESDQDPVNTPPHERIFSNETLSHRPDLFWAFPGIRRTASELELDAFVGDVLNPIQPSEPKFLGQCPGPDRYAAKTLRVLWEEEHVRTGLIPVVPEEQERSVLAGPTLSETHLVSKLYQLLNGKAASQKLSSIDEDRSPLSEMSDFQDVIQFLNSSSTTSAAEFGQVVDAENGSVTSDSAVDANEGESDDMNDWADIARSTQALLAIPQGDGYGQDVSNIEGKRSTCGGKKRSKQTTSSSRPLRRRLIGDYQRLQTVDDVRSDLVPCTPSINHGLNEKPKREYLSTDLKQSDDSLPNFSQSKRYASLELCPDDTDSDVGEHSHYLDDNSMTLKPVEEVNEVQDGERLMSNVVAPSHERERHTILHADEVVTPLKNEISRVRKDNPLQYPKCFDVGENLPFSATLVCPKNVPPSRACVAGNFGLGKLPSQRYLQPFYGNFNDYSHKPQRFAGIANRVRCGGVRGLAHFESEFVQTRPPKISCLWSIVVPVRPPPCALVVASNSALAGEGFASGYSVGRRTALDSAGREVKIVSRSRGELQSCTPLSMPEVPASNVKIRRFRRRVETCIPNNDDSETSGDSDREDMSRPSGTCGAHGTQDPQTQEPDLPLSPKYDDTTFFPETYCRSRKRTTSDFDLDSPVHRVKAEGVRLEIGKAPIALMSRADHQNLTVTLIEVIASSHNNRRSDPRIDVILAVCIIKRDERRCSGNAPDSCYLFLLDSACCLPNALTNDVKRFSSETALLDGVALALCDIDPDVIAGFETQTGSIGYLLDRADSLNHEFMRVISRVMESSSHCKDNVWGVHTREGRGATENAGAKYFHRKGADVKIPGRHVLNVWRVVRSEVKLGSYSLEGVANAILDISIPKHDAHQLEAWLRSERRAKRVLQHLRDRSACCLSILDKLNVLSRTGELARVYGIDFMSVLTRGSQYRVESMLARVAHERGFLLLSAQREQVFDQPAVECLPLVMEPSSAFYVDPVIVLDFQSLYPSMVIAHNLCYSTMLGNVNRMTEWSDQQHIGVVSKYQTAPAPVLQAHFRGPVDENTFIAPNGELFVTASVRRGVLPQMLREVLETRIMVKTAMKKLSKEHDTDLLKLMNARQFGLKMIANVTYGYASASFSGRMPCSGLADSIVQCGRDALEKIVRYVDGELHVRTGAQVVYGDTDSLFVRVPGASRAQAFEIGREISAKASSMFPVPVVLQLEKVYHPCVLLTKKRYVGYAYDSEDCATPVFDAKGIETVRRDSCGVVQKTLELALRVLFESKDISRVKRIVQRTMQRILSNRTQVADYIFRKEVRLGTYKDVLPPAAVVATRAMESDPRASPRHGERVAFVVVYAGQGAGLKDSVMGPIEFLEAETKGLMRIHSTYYITKQILPALNRVFSLLGASVSSWYAELPRVYFEPTAVSSTSRIHSYFPSSSPCTLCRGRCPRSNICSLCLSSPVDKQASRYIIAVRQAILDSKMSRLRRSCMRCIGAYEYDPREVQCLNMDCPVKFVCHRTSVLAISIGRALNDDTIWDPS